ncbi:MAG: transcription-repair coupling factor, partial [Bdellovibrionota bacterium]
MRSIANSLETQMQVFEFTGFERSPYFGVVTAGLVVGQERLKCLAALVSRRKNLVIVTTPAGFSAATMPPTEFAAKSFSLAVGMNLDARENLVTKLLQAGYRQTDLVEDPGSFSVRGEIVDFYSPSMETPIRLELFDTIIEKIRTFDIEDQRVASGSVPPIHSLVVLPAREVVLDSESAPRLREALKSYADDCDVPRTVRDPVMAQIAPSLTPVLLPAWGPFAYGTPGSLMDFLPNSTRILRLDSSGLAASWNRFLDEQRSLHRSSLAGGCLLPPPEALYPFSKLESQIDARFRQFRIDPLEMLDSGGPAAAPVRVELAPALWTPADSAAPDSALLDLLPIWIAADIQIRVFCATQTQVDRIRHILTQRGLPTSRQVVLSIGSVTQNFRWPDQKLILLNDRALLGQSEKGMGSLPGKASSASRDWTGLKSLTGIAPGELVVHLEHGIGRFAGLVRLDHGETPGEFLTVEYAENDKLYVPVYRLDQLQKYSAATGYAALDRLGGPRFASAKARAKEAVQALAVDLVKLYAERKIRRGIAFPAPDLSYREFEAKFPFPETPGQLLAIEAIEEDLTSGRIMDRLICGDVGFGKTEVAMRAAFLAVSAGKQVAVLVPTTLLAEQHERTFLARFGGYPIQVAGISRFKSPAQQKETLAAAASGKIDLLIGTHRLLSQDVKFQDLGLIIIDEEHRFGVDHKEKLKTLRLDSHVLTLSATPIPRTLNMALSGLREISLITTPPNERLPIRTFVAKSDDGVIQRAIEQELGRGGQVFFVHNRVQTIDEMGGHLRTLLPKVGIVIAHGQMAETQLSRAMDEFVSGRARVLVCTSIIESGLDLPNANTLIVNRADTFGLAQLYQIRGRVGRSNVRAYACLLIPSVITDDALKRLEVLQRFIELGSGFSIASHDLEIRGVGELLGPRQSGHVTAIGFDLYTELLEDAIHTLRGEPPSGASSLIEPEIKIRLPAYFPDTYVTSAQLRLSLYRRLSAFRESNEIDEFEIELRERFGPLAGPAAELLWLLRLKL